MKMVKTPDKAKRGERVMLGNRQSSRINVPNGALKDAKTFMQWSPGNICFEDSYFKLSCEKKWGYEIFREACKRTAHIPMPRREVGE